VASAMIAQSIPDFIRTLSVLSGIEASKLDYI
jgi:hypothetical protein